MRRNELPIGRALVVWLAVVLGCVDVYVSPTDSGSISLLAVSGGGQSGVVGTELPLPLVVKASDSKGNSVAGLVVSFRVASGGGSVRAGTASTDSRGIAQDYWILGTSTALPQSLEVRAVSSNGQTQVYSFFAAMALPGPVAKLSPNGPGIQSTSTANPVPAPPSVAVSDRHDNPVPAVAVTFAVASGGGSLTGGSALTNAQGIAAVGSWTTGPIAGSNILTASVAGIPPLTFTATTGGLWTSKPSMPTPRYGLGVGVINGILYAAGGYHDAPNGALEAYDPVLNAWTAKRSMPTPRYGLGVGVINGFLYAVGGAVGIGRLEVYDPVGNTWTTKATMPTQRQELGVGVVNGMLYAVGGLNFTTVTRTVEAYDPIRDIWITRAPMSLPRSQLGVGVVNDLLYAVGGYNPDSGARNTLEVYDPTVGTWTRKSPMPTARAGLTVSVMNGILYAIGGGNPGARTIEAYHPATDTWTTESPMPTARWLLTAGSANGSLYAIGGYLAGAAGNSGANVVEAHRP